ncbi:MAG TPA: bifunctional lysylphosphatidylglycerol flippase/synthetase MprF [Thermoanaerobaculia bacterium]|jgi:phosphatidylglycerol lysyltransferase|nr:bifunctional lysylphosphatidylglycerol flippase/synthetase MprF [Thermoanaerobaculia bacterium]
MRRRLMPYVSALLFLAALWLLRRELSSFHYHQVAAFLSALPAGRLLLALALTAAGYLALTGYDMLAGLYTGRVLPYGKTALASFVGYAVSNALGHPLLTGTPLKARMYNRWGIAALDVTRLVLFSLATFWLGFCTLAGLAFSIEPLALPPVLLALGLTSTRPIGALFLALVAAYLAASAVARARKSGPLKIQGFELAIPRPSLALAQIAISSLDWALAGAVLYALLPDSWRLSFPAFLGIYLLAQIGGLASQVPGGLGVFEGILVVLLPQEIPRSEALGALVAYRGIYYFLPLLIAALLLGGHELRARREQVGRIARRVRRIGRLGPELVPPVLAVLTFAGGIVLLASGATPAEPERLAWLDNFLPLPLLEVSHFVGSLVGVALLFLAQGLRRRVDAAYPLTVALLAAGIVTSLAKGLDWEEALVLAAMLAALLPCRRFFSRRAALFGAPFTPGWIVAIATVLAGSIWLGLFAYSHVDYSHELWWRFALDANAPRFLRASVGGLALVVAFAFARLLRPSAPRPTLPTPADLDLAATIAAASPRSSAHLALLGDKELLWSEDRSAFLMYAVEHRSWVAMGDPVGPEAAHAEIAWRFRELSSRFGGWPVFYQVSPASLPLYVDLGLTLLKLGEEARVPLATFDLEGRARKKLRHAHKKGVEAGCTLEIRAPGTAPPIEELAAISDDWLEHKGAREKGFSLGFFDPDYLSRTPIACVSCGGKIVAFANLWPGAPGTEMSLDLMRYHRDAPAGVMDYLFLELLLLARREGYSWFNLGMAPLSGLAGRALAPFWSRLGSSLYRHGEAFYNFQGLRQYKEKFDPVWEPRYLAAPGGLVLPRVLGDLATLIGGGLRGALGR